MKPRIRIMLGLVLFAGLSSGCASELYNAAERGDLKAVQTLVGQGAVINEASGIDGEVPLVGAAQNGKMEVVQFLLSHGADVNKADDFERTALHAAAAGGHLSIVQLLLERGANVNSQNRFKFTPLSSAASAGHAQVVKLLLDRGADVSIPDYWGTQPLWWAVRGNGNAEIVQMLLEHGADPGVKGREIDIMQDWRPPLTVAQEKGNTRVIRLLQQAEARLLGAADAPSVPTAAPASPAPAAVPASDVDQPPAVRAKPRENAYAVVIGIDTYRNKLPKADYASHDAEIMGTYLTNVMGYEEENVAVLLNDRAAKTDLEKYIEHWLPKRVEPGASVFIYFSGHGAPNPKTGDAYLVPYDGDPAFVDATGYPLKRLYDQVGKLQAKEIVVMLDSCFSGAGGRSVIAKGMRPMVLSVENPVLAGGKTVVLAASQGDQVSSTYDQKGHGLLTYFFLKGLQGEADRNKDGSVDLAELFSYLKPQVERKARRDFNNEQTPQLLGSPELLRRGVRLVERAGP
ncbi:MAG: peptidase C14 [Nitrospirae bacterium]|nr:MAG: peptidase C14 [Nitrospirota bacterium]